MLAEHTTGEPCAEAANCTRDAMCRRWVQRTVPRSLCKPGTQLGGRAPRPQTARGARCVAAGCNAPRCAACANQEHATGGLRVLVANCTRDAVCRERTTKRQQTSPHTQSDTHKPCRLQGGVPWEPSTNFTRKRPTHAAACMSALPAKHSQRKTTRFSSQRFGSMGCASLPRVVACAGALFGDGR